MSTAYFAEGFAAYKPRHRVAYSASGPAVLRNVHRDRDGRLLVISEGEESVAIRLDYDGALEDGEHIVFAELSQTGITAGVDYGPKHVQVHVETPGRVDCNGEVAVRVTFSTGEQRMDRIRIEAKNRCDHRSGYTLNRGVA